MVSDGINGPLRGPVFCRSVLPHTIAVPGIYALAGYPVARLDVGLSTYRRVAAEDSATPSQRAILMRLITLSVSLPHTVCWVSDNPRPSGPPSIGALKFYVEKYVY